MSIWNQTWKRIVLALGAVAIAFSWTQTGRAQAPCVVGRGLDPLDVVNSGIRHNVWIMFDSSGSMGDPFPGGGTSKLNVARNTIKNLMETLVDGAGRPLVNWAFVHYDPTRDGLGKCGRPDVPDDLDEFPDQPDGCIGLHDSSLVPPSLCDGDSRPEIIEILDGVTAGGITPIGITFTDIAEFLTGKTRDPLDASIVPTGKSFVADLLPNQKNFIIQVTDGRDTCECEGGVYPPVFGSPLISPADMRPDPVDPTFIETSTVGGDFASFNAGQKGEIALRNIDPALDGEKGNIFVIGMDLSADDKRRINTIAWMASGAAVPGRDPELMSPAFFADDEEALVAAFEDILSKVGIPSSTLSLGAASVASVKEVIASHTDLGVDPLEVIPPAGSDATAFRGARQLRADRRNNVRFQSTVEIPGFRGHLTATNIYSVDDPTRPRTERSADFTPIWDAGVELEDDDPDDRPMFFNKRGSLAVLPFDTSNVTPADLGVTAGYLSELDGTGARTANDARDIVVQVTRGYRLSLDPDTGTIYKTDDTLNLSKLNPDGSHTWKLYENLSGSVAVVSNPPRSPDFDPPLVHGSEYGVGGAVPGDGFYWDHINRRTIVYYPSNFGILHGFDGQFGTEVVAFIADDTLGLAPEEVPGSRDTLKDVVALVVKENNGIVNHKFTLASAPTAQDAFLRSDRSGGDDDWHTLLVYGRGRGGRFLTALDVTTVPSDPSSLRLLWNRGNREGVVEGQIDGLGETWSVPVMGNVATVAAPSPLDTDVDQWLVFAGGGYGCDNADNEGQFIFAFRAEDGFIYAREQVTNDPSATISYNALPARPTLFNPHETDIADFKDVTTRAYIPDLQGNVWKLDTSAVNPADWTFGIFASMGPEHPITAPVTLLNDVLSPSRVFVMAGSGGDRRAGVPVEGFKFRVWLDNDPDGANTFQYAADDASTFERSFLLEERMFEQAVTVGQIGDPRPPAVFFVASEENFDTDACVVSFRSTLYATGVESGLPLFDLDSTTAGEESTDLGEGKAFLFARDANIYVTRSGGLGVSSDVEMWGEEDNFDVDSAPGGMGGFTLQLRVDGFRISPF